MTEADPTLERLEDQINWYDRKSNYSQKVYKWLKIIEIVAAALVPLSAGLHQPAPVTGSLGVLIAVLEGLLQLNQYHQQLDYLSVNLRDVEAREVSIPGERRSLFNGPSRACTFGRAD